MFAPPLFSPMTNSTSWCRSEVFTGKGSRHPLRTYLKYGVPVALVTDDAGVSRSTLTLEYRKAVEEQGVDYRTLKRMARNSIAYCFADAPTKKRLAADLEVAFQAFERRTSNDERRRD